MIEEFREQLHDELLQQPVPPCPPSPVSIPRSSWLRRFVRLLLRRALYSLVALGKRLRPAAAFLVIILLLLGLSGWMGYQLWGGQGVVRASAPDTRVMALPEAPEVVRYVQGNVAYNADEMWDALSPSYQEKYKKLGMDRKALHVKMFAERQRNITYIGYEYIGGVPVEYGGTMYFYVLIGRTEIGDFKIPLIFMIDEKDGKIVAVTPPLNR